MPRKKPTALSRPELPSANVDYFLYMKPKFGFHCLRQARSADSPIISHADRKGRDMSDDQFIAFMELLMCSDPWPLMWGQELLNDLADDQARARGFCDWIEAYHKLDRPLIEKVRLEADARP